MRAWKSIALFVLPAILAPWPAVAQTVSGTVYRDFDADGQRAPMEPGVAGLVVTAFDDLDAVVGTAMTQMDGTYSAPLTAGAGTPIRLEISNLPGFLDSGPFGPESGTTVIFTTSGSTNQDLAVHNPAQFCQADPLLATSCYIQGDQTGSPDDVLISFPWSAGAPGTSPPPGVDQPPYTPLAEAQEIGPTWGLAYQRSSASLFATALMKRHTSFGPGGTGAIYRIDVVGGGITTFLDLNALFGAGTAGADPHPMGTDFSTDPLSWDPVGKIGLGDIDISDDETTLWTINLADRQLYEIPIGLPPTAPPAGSIVRRALPMPTDCPDPAIDIRPFATAVRDGLVYVGMVCSAQSTQDPADLRAYVYTFDGASFTEVLNEPLDYPRGCALVSGGCDPDADWLPWITVFTVIPSLNNIGEFFYPQPWLTDIEFVGDTMMLGIRDRFGDQMGFNEFDPAMTGLFIGDSAGDTLCASFTGPGWSFESNGTCGTAVSAGGVGNGEGPGSGEFFSTDNHPQHDETTLGGLANLPGTPELLSTLYDPIFDIAEIFAGGIGWYDSQDGSRARAYRVYETTVQGTTFAKGGGLGDLEALCDPAPLEVGNRLWEDLDRDGVQDPSEPVLAGVTLELLSGAVVIATTVTDANGQYLFNAANVPGGVPPLSALQIRFDLLDPALGGRSPTVDNDPNDLADSDFVIQGMNAVVDFMTGSPGQNNHTLDAGVVFQLDYGDAPEANGYPTLLASDGARHIVLPVMNPTLGTLVDPEVDGQPAAGSDGDDAGGAPDDEDGVVFVSFPVPGQTVEIEVSAGTTGGIMNAWLDFNGNGDFLDAGEQIATDLVLAASAVETLMIPVPADAATGLTVGRFRLSSVGGLAPTGEAPDGEIEDHLVQISAPPITDVPALDHRGIFLFAVLLLIAAAALLTRRRSRI